MSRRAPQAPWLLPAGVLLLAACATSTPGGKEKPAPAADERDQIRFSHALHQEQEIACDSCHQGVAAADRLDRSHAPSKEACAECHDVKSAKECGKCHRDPARAKKLAPRPPTKRLVFSHAKHAKRAKDCVTCHAGAAVARSLAEVPRPKMRTDCFGCHNHLEDYRAVRCQGCHQSLSHYPIRFVSAFNHEGNFLAEHGRWARSSADLCASCHAQSFCADCHGAGRAVLVPSAKWPERVGRQFIHRGDWLSQHALQSRIDPGRCTKCHSPKSCDACHRSRGVAAATASFQGTSPHPTGWLNPGSPNSHGREARRHITQCASCHDRGSQTNCIRCHRSVAQGGMGLNPHPPGWSRGGKTTDRVCLLCH